MKEYDAIVVGARCAGASVAMLLARKGHRVLLLDRGTFPSDTISTHIVWPPGVARLARWGLLDRVAASNAPPIRRVTFDVGDVAFVGVPPPAEGATHSIAPRRTVLDALLVEAAAAAGAEVREGVAVQDVTTDEGCVTGVRGQTRGRMAMTERARIVVGADGMHSIVARSVHAGEYDANGTLACWYYTYWSDVPVEGVEYYPRVGSAVGAIPTNDGLTCIPVAWVRADFERVRSDVEGTYLAALELAPGLAERVRRGRREERFYGTGDVPNFFRKAYGRGWALVGDAGYHKDPITAQGISDAFRGAELLADAIDAGFSGRTPLDRALDEYQRVRDAQVRPMYGFTCQLAALEAPSPEMQRLFAALPGNQPAADGFVGTIAGTVPVADYFAEENQRRITST